MKFESFKMKISDYQNTIANLVTGGRGVEKVIYTPE